MGIISQISPQRYDKYLDYTNIFLFFRCFVPFAHKKSEFYSLFWDHFGSFGTKEKNCL